MRFSRPTVIFFLVLAALPCAEAWQQTESKPVPSTSETARPVQAPAKPAETGAAVDAAKVTGSTFESPYFKFTYELPKGWKALDDAARIASNQQLAEQEKEEATAHAQMAKTTSSKTTGKRNPAVSQALTTPGPERYSLMVAGPNGVDSIASPDLPRINIWAHKRIPPLDTATDHAQFLLTGQRTQVLARPQPVELDGHPFVRVDVVSPEGTYHSQFVTEIGDFLVGFDFRAQSEREMTEMESTTKSIKFK